MEHSTDHMEVNFESHGVDVDSGNDKDSIEPDNLSVDGPGSNRSDNPYAYLWRKHDFHNSNSSYVFNFMGLTVTKENCNNAFRYPREPSVVRYNHEIINFMLPYSFQIDNMDLVREIPYIDASFKLFLEDMQNYAFAMAICEPKGNESTKTIDVDFIAVEIDVLPLVSSSLRTEYHSPHGTKEFLEQMGYLFNPGLSTPKDRPSWPSYSSLIYETGVRFLICPESSIEDFGDHHIFTRRTVIADEVRIYIIGHQHHKCMVADGRIYEVQE